MATIALRRLVASIESGVSVVSDASLTGAANYVLKTSAVSSGTFDVAERKPVADPKEVARLACAVAAGNLIVSRMNTPELVGACGFVEESVLDTYLPDRLWQVKLRTELCCPKFVYWWTATEQYRAQVKSVCAGTSQSMQNISQEQFLGFSLPLFPVTVQQRIADYLDAKTGAIDALIAKKELLIEELRKYQEAVIAELIAAAGGASIPVKRCFDVYGGSTPVSDHVAYWGGPITWVTPADLAADEMFVTKSARTLTDSGYESCGVHLVSPGSIILSCRAPIGSLAIAGVPLCTNQGCKSLVPRKGFNSEFFYFQLAGMVAELNSLGSGATFLELSASALKEVQLTAPDTTVQNEVAKNAKRYTRSIGDSIENAKAAVQELKAYRAALISEAVTGKISL